jgi:PEP-CTERM motif-containing protein
LNGFTTVLIFNDAAPSGDFWYEAKLTFAQVPEPASFWLLVIGTALICLRSIWSRRTTGTVQLFAGLDREQPAQLGLNCDVTGGCSRPVSFALARKAGLRPTPFRLGFDS